MNNNNRCKKCNHPLKKTLGTLILNTRLKNIEEIVIEDLKFKNCTVCSYKVLDSKYKDIPNDIVKYFSKVNKFNESKKKEETSDIGIVNNTISKKDKKRIEREYKQALKKFDNNVDESSTSQKSKKEQRRVTGFERFRRLISR